MGSLFAGIGGFDLGFERAGFETVWEVEIDPFCRRVLERHFPRAERFADIRECGSHNLRSVDVICGGFPCQDISNAGRRAGLDGERSGLWSEYLRIVCELRPRFVFVENVSALLHMGLGRILGELAACGYDAEWDCLPAVAFGAPHIRDRIWILAYPMLGNGGAEPEIEQGQRPKVFGGSGAADVADAGSERRQQIGGSAPGDESADEGRASLRDYEPECGGEGCRTRNLAHAERESTEGRDDGAERRQWSSQEATRDGRPGIRFADEWWAVEPDVGRVAHGVPARVDRLRSLGNAVVPQIAQFIAERIKAVMDSEKSQ